MTNTTELQTMWAGLKAVVSNRPLLLAVAYFAGTMELHSFLTVFVMSFVA